ncbi:MAG TPA: polymer-forming cytoskeletal protein [Gemmatimonadales bacterium]|nr:polymer-forming cytoskeletal protein [Gemmatimonadales bacterium]
MRSRNPLPRFALILAATLAGVAAPLHAESPGIGENLRNKIEKLTGLLRDEQSRVITDHSVSVAAEGASLHFAYDDGKFLTLGLESGDVLIGGKAIGHYPKGGALEGGWRQLMLDASRTTTPSALTLVRRWHPDGLSREEEEFLTAMQQTISDLSAPVREGTTPQSVEPAQSGGLVIDLRDLSDVNRVAPLLRSAANLHGANLRVTVPEGSAHAGTFTIGTAERLKGPILVIRGDANIYGLVEGNLATVRGNIVVHPGGVITGDVLSVAGRVSDLGGEIRGQIRTLDTPRFEGIAANEAVPDVALPGWKIALRNGAGVLGVFSILLMVGFGLVVFARPPLEVVSDTVMHSFSRALLVGLLGQVLILPTFGMLVVGLILTVAGVLLVPFAVIVFGLLLVVGVLGGFLAIAHAMGESVTRRQLAMGAQIMSANSYRYVAVGLAGIAALWLLWVAFGWVPVAGTLILATAVLVTWLLATVGFGAALLSRAGFREHFAGRLLPAESLTDEYLWLTPQFGVTAVKRPPKGEKTPPPL